MSNRTGENIIQCKSTDGGKVGRNAIKRELKKHGDSKEEGKYRAYTFVTNGEFTKKAKTYLKDKKSNGWAIEWIENAKV